ncbi:hypothetical protein EDB80DRAFT_877436 [Ilyonectria destructans]|nr:hypothetical protein EDB80DRAFT_877436 [Ilyonectria destructans]
MSGWTDAEEFNTCINYNLFLLLCITIADFTTRTTETLPTLSPRKLQKLTKLEKLGLHYNAPEPAIICIQCGFAIHPKRASRHPGDKHNVVKSARYSLKPLIASFNLPDPDTLPLRPDGSRPHLHLAIQTGSACKHCSLHSTSEKVLATHLKACHHDKIRIAAGQQKHHWLRDHIKEGLAF